MQDGEEPEGTNTELGLSPHHTRSSDGHLVSLENSRVKDRFGRDPSSHQCMVPEELHEHA